MKLPAQTEVLIVGAGPTGLTLAAELARLGIHAVVIDKQREGANTSRAAVVHARTLEVLEPIGATPELLARGLKVSTFHVRDRGRSLLEISFAHLDTTYPFTLMCPQSVTEEILNARLVSLDGAVQRHVELETLEIGDENVDAYLATADGKAPIWAGWVVGCDGAHSTVRSQAGIPFEGGAYEEDFILADVRMDWPLPRNEVNLFFSASGLMVVAPLPADRFRIVATATAAPAQADTQYMQSLVDERGPSQDATLVQDIVWSSRFHIQHRVTATPRAGRVLLCGDAAHVHSPAGGQGMNTGIQDAAALAAPLAAAVKSGDTGGLTEWEARRHAVARNVVALTDRMTRAATVRSLPARLARNAVLLAIGHVPGVTEAVARRLSELDYR